VLALCRALTFVTAFGVWTLGGSVFAGAPPVRDHANLFSSDAIAEANGTAEAIQTHFDKHVVIETFSSVPWTARLTHNFKEPQARDQFFADWAKRNARRAGPDSIYVLICNQPAPQQVELVPGREAQPFFSSEDVRQARTLLLARLRQGQPDTALLESIRLIGARLQSNGATAPPPKESFPWGQVVWLVPAIIAFWGLVELAHYLTIGRSHPADVPTAPVGYGEGGSLPAGLFVTMTTRWLHDLWRREPDLSTTAPLEAKRVPVAEPDLPLSDEVAAHTGQVNYPVLESHEAGHGAGFHDKP
jgi:hypothetical protein